MDRVGLYIHIPFCERKCFYCDFYSGKYSDEVKEKYVEELIAEIKAVGERAKNKKLKTVYIGGGTPSSLPPELIEKIAFAVYENFDNDIREFTIEVNPNSNADFGKYKEIGINRVSVGVQTLDDALLRKIGRLHNSAEALRCLDEANKYFDNVSVDLMIGLTENQNVKKDLSVISDRVKHLSAYMLKVEDGTPLQKLILNKSVSVATENAIIKQYDEVAETCKEKGFIRYEVSNFARSGYESKHNSSYWNMTDYYGVGAAAHSYVDGARYYNSADIDAYINGLHSGNGSQIIERVYSVAEDKEEYVMLALRTCNGLNLDDYRKRYDEDFIVAYATKLDKIKNYIDISNGYVRIKEKYILVQNSVISELI